MVHRLLILIPVFILASYLLLVLTNGGEYLAEESLSFKITHVQLNNDDELLKLGLTPRHTVKIEHVDGKSQLIHGRFLHITDMHPDEFYEVGSSILESCHRKKGKGDDKASKYGDAVKGCDSPLALVEETLLWISENLKDKIDFVIWTGDNIRHDNDRGIPRLETNIFEMNEKIADMVYDRLVGDDSSHGIKVVPSLGNNDVYPHNLFAPGPTLQTRELYKIWKNFVPSEQLHVFARGAYFFQEIIPNKLAVLSINTLYLFRSNPLVDNCDKKKEPGYKLFEWLGFTLKELRARKMKVWLTGHVPPTPKNYDTTCLRKHIVWLYEYRDIIIGSLYGHMNIDHFIPLDSQKAYRSINKNLKTFGLKSDAFNVTEEEQDEEEEEEEEDFYDLEEMNSYLNIISNDEIFGSEPHIMGGAPMGKVEYMESIRDAFYSRVKGKKKHGVNSERYSIAHISSSVVPTFNPGLRVWEYNTTGLFEDDDINEYKPWTEFLSDLDQKLFPSEEEGIQINEIDYDSPFMTEENLVEILKKDKTYPPKMPHGTPLGPAYTPQLFSPERYVQYYVDLAKLNEKKDAKVEYKIEYETDDEHYNMKSLLVDDWVTFSRKLGAPIKNQRDRLKKGHSKNVNTEGEKKLEKLWRHYLTRSFVSTGYEDMKDYI